MVHQPPAALGKRKRAADPDCGSGGAVELQAELMDDLRVEIWTFKDTHKHAGFLEQLQPAFVAMYDPDPGLVRELERYHCSSPPGTPPLRLFLLAFEESVEERRYLGAVQREKQAFQSLIEHKASMIVTLDAGDAALSQQQQQQQLVVDSRSRERGRPARRRYVVDLREFRSVLPSLLHQSGAQLVPATLTVGDFVISPALCVERKSISDLYSSLNSGRLYNQAEAMCRHYASPCLLIEFSGERAFVLQTASEIKDTLDATSIASKLVLLAIAFPRLRMVWSKDPRFTVDLFAALTEGAAPADADAAVAVGSEEAQGASELNQQHMDLLLRLPGVTVIPARGGGGSTPPSPLPVRAAPVRSHAGKGAESGRRGAGTGPCWPCSRPTYGSHGCTDHELSESREHFQQPRGAGAARRGHAQVCAREE